MHAKETFQRCREIGREKRMLPAATYKLLTLMRRRHPERDLFIPMRNMLFLAVVDDEEIIFIDGAVSRSRIELAWQNFKPQQRKGLDDPIAYEIAYYTRASLALMQRLQGEFQRALMSLCDKQKQVMAGRVIPFGASGARRSILPK